MLNYELSVSNQLAHALHLLTSGQAVNQQLCMAADDGGKTAELAEMIGQLKLTHTLSAKC